jgi:HK97 family phage major capsid protein
MKVGDKLQMRIDKSSIELDSDGGNVINIRCCDETVVDRHFGTMSLSHDKGHVDLSSFNNGALFIKNHESHDVESSLGKVIHAEVRDKALFAKVQLTSRPSVKGIVDDILTGILTSVSIGTDITEILSEVEVDDSVHYKVAHKPYEVSLVVDPAIQSAKIILANSNSEKKNTTVKKKNITLSNDSETTETETTETETTQSATTTESDADKVENARVTKILKLAKTHNVDAKSAVAEGVSFTQFQSRILRSMELNNKPATSVAPTKIGLTDKESAQFSVIKAINACVNNDWSKAGFEREATIASAEMAGRTVKGNAFTIPEDVHFATAPSTTTIVNNPALVPTEHVSFIEALYQKTLLHRLGATTMFGLRGDIEIPRQITHTDVSWVGEDEDSAETTITTDLVTLSPKTAISIVPISHKLLIQNTHSIEQLIRNDLMQQIAINIDKAVLYTGTGVKDPLALISEVGLNAVAGAGDPTWDLIVEAYKQLEVNDAQEGATSWITSPVIVAKMMTTLKTATDTASQFLLPSHDAMLNGFNIHQSTICDDDKLILGNWSNLLIGNWNSPEIAVDPYTGFYNASIRLRVLADLDSAVRHPQGFSVVTGI